MGIEVGDITGVVENIQGTVILKGNVYYDGELIGKMVQGRGHCKEEWALETESGHIFMPSTIDMIRSALCALNREES